MKYDGLFLNANEHMFLLLTTCQNSHAHDFDQLISLKHNVTDIYTTKSVLCIYAGQYKQAAAQIFTGVCSFLDSQIEVMHL